VNQATSGLTSCPSLLRKEGVLKKISQTNPSLPLAVERVVERSDDRVSLRVRAIKKLKTIPNISLIY
jgi:hypothetical protein